MIHFPLWIDLQFVSRTNMQCRFFFSRKTIHQNFKFAHNSLRWRQLLQHSRNESRLFSPQYGVGWICSISSCSRTGSRSSHPNLANRSELTGAKKQTQKETT